MDNCFGMLNECRVEPCKIRNEKEDFEVDGFRCLTHHKEWFVMETSKE